MDSHCATTDRQVRVVVVDDEMLIREGIVSLLQADPRIAVIGTGSNGQEAIHLASELRPQGKAFAFAWGTLVECLGYIEQVFDVLNQAFACEEAPLVPAGPTDAAVVCRSTDTGPAEGPEARAIAQRVPGVSTPSLMS